MSPCRRSLYRTERRDFDGFASCAPVPTDLFSRPFRRRKSTIAAVARLVI